MIHSQKLFKSLHNRQICYDFESSVSSFNTKKVTFVKIVRELSSRHVKRTLLRYIISY